MRGDGRLLRLSKVAHIYNTLPELYSPRLLPKANGRMMLSSLPPVGPPNVSSLISTSVLADNDQAYSLVYPSPSTFHSNHSPSSQQPNGPQHFGRSSHYQPRNLLSVLRADENAILNRKRNIRRYGAGWLRPPGVPKTLQGMDDERAEREEQERAANRDFEYYEAHRAAEAEARAQAQERMALDEGEQQGQERDLDDDVPDADADIDVEDEDYEPYEDFDEPDGGWETGMVAVPTMEEEDDGDYAEGERDLDEGVPEASSYQHTDTELEDESSDEGEAAAFTEVGNTDVRGVLGSSVFGSSPALRVPGGRSMNRSEAPSREN